MKQSASVAKTELRRKVSRESAGRGVTVVVILVVVALVLFLGNKKQFEAQHYLQLAIDGIRGGSIYALIALGFVVIHSVTGIINFAQGEFVMLGAMFCATIYHSNLPLPPALKLILAIVLAVAATTLVGAILERVTIYPARGSPIVALIIITIGATMEMEDFTLRFGGLIVKAQSFWIWGTVAVVLAVLFYFFERTVMGKALRACAVNRRAAQLMGISPSRMSLLSFALAAALGAIGGIVLSPATRPTYDMGLILGLKGFVAAIMGGLVSSPGAVLGGLILGAAENIGAGVTSAGYKDIIAFVILILILLFRPQGLIGGGERAVEEG
jgi:branched-chain amino acid transport system permease protein